MNDFQRITLKRLAKLLEFFSLRNVSENAPQKDQVMGKSLVVLSLLSVAILQDHPSFLILLVPSIVETVQVQHFWSRITASSGFKGPHISWTKRWEETLVALPAPRAPTGEIVEQICPLRPFPTLLWGLLPTSAGETFPCIQRTVPLLPLCYHCPEYNSQLGTGLPISFSAEKKEQANYQTSYLIHVGEIKPPLQQPFSQKSEWEVQPFCLWIRWPCCLIPKYCGDNKPLSLWRSIPTCGSGLVLQSTPAEHAGCLLTAALLTLQDRADVPHGLPGQWPKQMPRSACQHFDGERALNVRMLYPCSALFSFSNNFYLNPLMHHLVIL